MPGEAKDTRFRARYHERELPRVVRAVAEIADPRDPVGVSQRAWDAARATSPYSDAPSARTIARRLGLSWRGTLENSMLPLPDAHAAVAFRRTGKADWLTEEGMIEAVKLVARRLGQDRLSPGEYQAERALMLRADRARYAYGGGLLLPTVRQVRGESGWSATVRAAGLRDDPRPPVTRSLPLGEIIERMYELYGVVPTRPDVMAFANANQHATPDLRDFAGQRDAWRAQRLHAGLATPDEPPARAARPDYSIPVAGARLPGEPRSKAYWRVEEHCVEVVAGFLRTLGPGDAADRLAYHEWSAQQPDAPSPQTLNRHHGSYARIRDLAWPHVRREPRRDEQLGDEAEAGKP